MSGAANRSLQTSSVDSSGTVYEEFDALTGMTVGFRPVTMELDFNRLYEWHKQPHVVPYWNLDIPESRYREHLELFLADSHQKLYIGMLNDEPMSYFESYWAKRDIIGRYYEAHPADQGIHLLIGPPSYLGRGLASVLLKAMMRFQLTHAATEKLVAEPDVRNGKMIHIFEKCGFRFHQEVGLPDKTGALMFAGRDDLDSILGKLGGEANGSAKK